MKFRNSNGIEESTITFMAVMLGVMTILTLIRHETNALDGKYIDPPIKTIIDRAIENKEGYYFSPNKVFFCMGTKSLVLSTSQKAYRDNKIQELNEMLLKEEIEKEAIKQKELLKEIVEKE